MNCDLFEQLSAYVDEALDADERAVVERHLFQCASCRADYRDLRAIQGKLHLPDAVTPLPQRLDLVLAGLAGNFLDGDEPEVRETTGVMNRPQFTTPRRAWRQLALAASIALATVIGMGFFAIRSGRVPTLSSVDHRIVGLSDFGHAAIHKHLEHFDVMAKLPVEPTRELDDLLNKRLEWKISLDDHAVFSKPLDARVIDLDGETVAMVDYRHEDVPVSLFVMPLALGVDELDLELEDVIPNACTTFDVHRCHTDSVGTAICVQTWHDTVRIWVGHLPVEDLDALVAPAPEYL